MSMDVKIERFGLEIFNRIFNDYELKDYSPEPMPKSYESVECELNEDIINAVKVYMGLFHTYYASMYDDAYNMFWNNEMDFLHVIIKSFPHEKGQFIASIAYVADLVLEGLNRGDSNFLSSAHLIWAMFVDMHLLEDFYSEGGWRVLRQKAYVLRPVYNFLHEHNDTDKRYLEMWHVPIVASVDANLSFQQKDCRYEGDDPLALRWVDWVVKGNDVDMVVNMDDFDALDLEESLDDLIELLDPHAMQDNLAMNAVKTAEELGVTEKQCMDAIANGTLEQYPGLTEEMSRCYQDFLRETDQLWSRNPSYSFYSSYPDPSTVVLSAKDGQINFGYNPSEELTHEEKCQVIKAITDYYSNTYPSCVVDKPPINSENAAPVGGSTPHDPSSVVQSARNITNPSNDHELIDKSALTNQIQNDDTNNPQSCTNQPLKSIENFSSSNKPLLVNKSNKMKGKDNHDTDSTVDPNKLANVTQLLGLLDQMSDILQMSPAVSELVQARLVADAQSFPKKKRKT